MRASFTAKEIAFGASSSQQSSNLSACTESEAAKLAKDAAEKANAAAKDLLARAEAGEFDGEGVPPIHADDEGRVLTVFGGEPEWRDAEAHGVDLDVGNGLKMEGKVLSVDLAEGIEGDNTLPVSSALVFTTVGNIDALLKTI